MPHLKFMKLLPIAIVTLLSASLVGRETIPGTKVSLVPPENFVKTSQFPGYMMEASGSSIMVTQVAGPFPQISAGFTKGGFATQGMELIAREPVNIGGHDAILIHASQPAHGLKYLKWLLALGNQEETVLVVATFPSQFEDKLSKPLKDSVLSTLWDTDAEVDFFSGLTFRIEGSSDLEIANKIGNNLILSRNGEFPTKDKGSPMVVAGSSITENWQVPGDLAEFTRNRFMQTKILSKAKITLETKITIDDLDGYAVSGTGVDIETGEPVFVKLCLLFTDNGYYILQGIVRLDDGDLYDPIFRDVFESFRRIR